MKFGNRSESNLVGVHPHLVRVFRHAIVDSPIDFVITEGLRTKEKQAALVKAGASRTMNSRHLTGHAVDIAAWVDGQIRWDWPLYPRLASHIKASAIICKVPIEWGGDWRTLRDGPHYQLTWKDYP